MGLQIELAQEGRSGARLDSWRADKHREACEAVMSGMVSGAALTGSPIKREHVRHAIVAKRSTRQIVHGSDRCKCLKRLAGPAGLEPATSWFVDVVRKTPPKAMDDDEDPTIRLIRI